MDILRELKAREDIRDALNRYCRGVDRCDMALALSAYHPDAWDAHGEMEGPATQVMAWAINVHLTQFISTGHYITNQYIEIKQDKARVESCIMGVMRYRSEGRLMELIGYGRYLDQFECREGSWRIVHRLVLRDAAKVIEVDEVAISLGKEMADGGRGRDDPSDEFFRAW
jgi:hypothetical protein